MAFQSLAIDLANGDLNTFQDVYLYDRVAQTNTLVSVAFDAQTGGQTDSFSFVEDISADGRYVAYSSAASNISHRDFKQCLTGFAPAQPQPGHSALVLQ